MPVAPAFPASSSRASLTSAPEMQRLFQRRMYRFNIGFLLAIAPIYLGMAWLRGTSMTSSAVLVIFGCMLLNLLWVQRHGNYGRGLLWLQTTTFVGVLAGAIHTFGVNSPAFWWLSVIPGVSLMCGMVRLGIAQCAVVVVYTALAFLLDPTTEAPGMPSESFRQHLAVALSTVYICANLAFAIVWRGKLQAALQEATVAALASADAKARFLAHMSHEIRTPLNGVIGAATLLRSGKAGEEQRRQLAALQEQSANALLTLINHVLDWSKLEAGKVQLETQPFSPRSLVSEANELFAVTAFDKRIELTSSFNPDVPRRVLGDPTRVRQIINNLVSNAIKFTDKGGVHIHVAMAGTASVRIEVADSGIGIPPAALHSVFEAFRQADDSVTRRFGGTGLGLSISKELAELMGGRIEASSEPGHGSTFTLVLPVQRPKADGSPTAPPGPAAEQSDLLLASASPGLTRHLRSLLQELQVEPRLVRGLPCEADLAGCRTLLLDAALLQASDPAWLQGLARRGIRLALMQALGAELAVEGMPEEVRALYKPIRLSALQDFLHPPAAGSATAREAADQAQAPQLHVLLCEDNPVNQMIVQVMLVELGASVVIAGNGREALECLRAERFDLVLMDMQMPELDGLSATREWRRIESGERGPRVPVICMTANAEADEGAAAVDAGMDGFLAKPFGLDDLRECLRRWSPRAADQRHSEHG